MENVTTLMPVNYKSQTSSAIAYSDFALEGMPVTNSFAIADITMMGSMILWVWEVIPQILGMVRRY